MSTLLDIQQYLTQLGFEGDFSETPSQLSLEKEVESKSSMIVNGQQIVQKVKIKTTITFLGEGDIDEEDKLLGFCIEILGYQECWWLLEEDALEDIKKIISHLL